MVKMLDDVGPHSGGKRDRSFRQGDPQGTISEDLAFLRAVAEQGRKSARLYGGHFTLWGVLTSLAYINQYVAETRDPPTYGAIGIGYLAMGVVGWGGSYVLGRSMSARSGAQSLTTRVFSTIFVAAGLVLSFFAVCALVSPTIPEGVIVIVAAQMLGLCFVASGLLAQMRWAVFIGVAWLAASVGFTALVRSPNLYPAAALAWLLLAAGPGVALSLARRREASFALSTGTEE